MSIEGIEEEGIQALLRKETVEWTLGEAQRVRSAVLCSVLDGTDVYNSVLVLGSRSGITRVEHEYFRSLTEAVEALEAWT